jgi:predicted ribosomally synthesized peptide with SipW-like signal peptide
MLVFVAAIVAGGTGAFFSDTETSTGNVFTAGAIDLTVDSEAHYNGSICTLGNHDQNTGTPDTYQWVGGTEYPVGLPCDGTWTATNLGASHKFFNYGDVKPGDEGENTISLHVDSNDAYACVDVTITKNDDVTCADPENEAEGAGICNTDDVNPLMDGELAQNLTFFAWSDWGATPGFGPVNNVPDVGEGDNIWQANEPKLFSNISGPASDVLGGKSYTLADASTGPLKGLTTNYIGLAWCAGTINATVPGTITCNGATMGNDAQTDSMEATIAFRVEQSRNNPNFSCTPRVPAPETGTVTLDKVVQFTQTSVVGVDVNDFTLHLVGPGGDHILVDQVAFPGLTPGAYVVSEVYSNDPVGIQFNASFSGSCVEIADTGTANMNVVAGVNPTCTITNLVNSTP